MSANGMLDLSRKLANGLLKEPLDHLSSLQELGIRVDVLRSGHKERIPMDLFPLAFMQHFTPLFQSIRKLTLEMEWVQERGWTPDNPDFHSRETAGINLFQGEGGKDGEFHNIDRYLTSSDCVFNNLKEVVVKAWVTAPFSSNNPHRLVDPFVFVKVERDLKAVMSQVCARFSCTVIAMQG